MRNTIAKLNELAASNLNTLLTRAENPAKMLGLLRSEHEEGIIAIQRELTRARRHAEAQRAEAARLARSADDWSGKAALAMQHAREDLARSALLVREQESAAAAQASAEAEQHDAHAQALAATLAQLEARLAELRSGSLPGSAPSAAPARGAERIIDRIGQLEKRIGFADTGAATPDPETAADAIERLAREARVDEALAELRQQSAPTKRKPK